MSIERLVLSLYDRLDARPALGWASLAVVSALLIAGALRLRLKEDISDFLPVDEDYRRAVEAYQEIAAGDRMVVRFGCEADSGAEAALMAAADDFADRLLAADTAGWLAGFSPRVDEGAVYDMMSFAYGAIPYLLTEADYDRLDSLVGSGGTETEAWMRERLAATHVVMTSQGGGYIADMLDVDPLGLFAPIGERLRAFRPHLGYELVDGYLFTPGHRALYATVASPFGSSETARNGHLVAMLEDVCQQTQAASSGRSGGTAVDVTLTGAPVIAVANARQIRRDSLLAMGVSVLLILALLHVFFRSLRPLLHIALATAFGFLFALGCTGLLRDSLSVIVIGIAAVIVGIAVNYPLHYVHQLYEERAAGTVSDARRSALRGLCAPLLIGNVTTVGAFLTLVPLHAVALRDLGLFSALMLVGTIVFVLVWMPHIGPRRSAGAGVTAPAAAGVAPQPAFALKGRNRASRWLGGVLLLATVALAGPAARTSFDTDMSHINYMTAQQRADMQAWEAMQGSVDGRTVYVVCRNGDAAANGEAHHPLEVLTPMLDSMRREGSLLEVRNPADMIPSHAVQRQRLRRWQQLAASLRPQMPVFRALCREAGFSDEAFSGFSESLHRDYLPQPAEWFEPLVNTVLTGYVGHGAMLAQLKVAESRVADVEAALRSRLPSADVSVFDRQGLNARIAGSLTSDFNYIGIACGCIVFVFLWLSFGRIELAALAFLPMAVGWVWILGLMHLLGLQFNIVNVILATFIFGQGDDYTIFVTEGLIRDYRTGGRSLDGFWRSIMLSALIMLVGIGSLVLARHPAMFSLGAVTIIGMAVVVLMAWLLPPLVFGWLVRFDRPLRQWLDKGRKPSAPI